LELGERAARVRGEPDGGCTVWRRPARATVVKEAGSGSRAAGVEVTTIPNRWWWPSDAGGQCGGGQRERALKPKKAGDGVQVASKKAGDVRAQ
jgi:hypothetical protein